MKLVFETTLLVLIVGTVTSIISYIYVPGGGPFIVPDNIQEMWMPDKEAELPVDSSDDGKKKPGYSFGSGY